MTDGDRPNGEEQQDEQNGLPDVMGKCDSCSYKICRGSVEERVRLLSQEGEIPGQKMAMGWCNIRYIQNGLWRSHGE
mgnify:CR=1 FL=1